MLTKNNESIDIQIKILLSICLLVFFLYIAMHTRLTEYIDLLDLRTGANP